MQEIQATKPHRADAFGFVEAARISGGQLFATCKIFAVLYIIPDL